MEKKIYLLGHIPMLITPTIVEKFAKSQKSLTKSGYKVINPLDRILKKDLGIEEAKQFNLKEVMQCDAIYIMPCFNFKNSRKNLELKWALDCNLIIINGTIEVVSEEQFYNYDIELELKNANI